MVEIEGIDRLVIGVKDLDKGLALFGEVLGAKFQEVKGGPADLAGVRLAIDLDKHLELISPVDPKDMNPPDPVTLARWLEERGDGLLYALVLRVKDLDSAIRELQSKGIRIVGNRIERETVEQFGLQGFKEVCLCEDDTFGIKIALVEYQRTDSPVS
ncbi:MAG: VOC family protein [Deltaproteobacteria bacterium]|nr:VOC family protein [Deltaproteobacteria bacterium]